MYYFITMNIETFWPLTNKQANLLIANLSKVLAENKLLSIWSCIFESLLIRFLFLFIMTTGKMEHGIDIL